MLMQTVGDFQLENFRNLEVQEEEKEPRELVSFVDRESENMLFEKLSKLYPQAEFWGEENGKSVVRQTGCGWLTLLMEQQII